MIVKLEVMRSFQVLKKLEVITKVNLRYFRRSWYRIHLWRAANGYRLQRHWGKWPWSFGTWCGRKQYATVKWWATSRKKAKRWQIKIGLKTKFLKAQRCVYETNVFWNVAQNTSPLTIFDRSATLFDLVQLICKQTNLCATQNGREFHTTTEKTYTFLGLNNMVSLSKLPKIKYYC